MTIQEIMTSLKEWLLNKFAQKDGDYASLNSGTSNDFKKIGGGAEDGWLYRKCPQDNIGTGARLEKIKGKTLVWNNVGGILTLSKISGYNRTTTESGDDIVITPTSASTSQMNAVIASTNIANHIYYCMAYYRLISGADITSDFSNANSHSSRTVINKVVSASGIYTKVALIARRGENMTGDNYGLYFKQVISEATDSFAIKKEGAIIADLTLMFGTGNEPSTVAEFEAIFPGYYEYNAGTLISNDAEALKTVGFNQWDEEWEVGLFNTIGEKRDNSNCIRSKKRY